MNSIPPPLEPLATPDREVAPGFARAMIVLKPRKATPFYARHPWVFDSAVERIEGEADDGDIVDLVSEKRKFIARGILNRHSRLMVRLYTWQASQAIDDDFWQQRIERAVALRSQLGYDQPTSAGRLVYSEADGLSGLIVDRYAGHLVVQVNSLGVALRADRLVELLARQLAPDSITLRCDAGIAKAEGITLAEGLCWGQLPGGLVFIEEHGLRYGVDLVSGQKTGFYLDQRENRRVAAGYLRDRQVLDLFCYSGGFSLTASRLGGAREVLGIDTSDKAVALARANAELNGVSNAHFERGDGFTALDEFLSAGRRFQAIVLDPPKFTRSRQSVDEALRAYHRLNRVAVDLLEPGGILVTCSCSGSVSREEFLQMLAVVSQKCSRDLQVLEQRGASPDHPVSPTCPESEYLKCFICRAN
jgi:23S rRNA (cytosine1962-C5)-methyltransferase